MSPVCIVIAADISTSEGADKCVEEVMKVGHLDVLVNNVGIFEVKEFEDITDDDWLKYFQVCCVDACAHVTAMLRPRRCGTCSV